MGNVVEGWRIAPHRTKDVLLFLLIPGLSAISPILVYPAITEKFGAIGFASVAIGQSIGTTAAVACELGWSVIGPQAVARGTDLTAVHRTSVATKMLALAPGVPIAGVAAYLVSESFRTTAALTAVALAVSALSPVWLLTGLNRPGIILLVDALPRVAFTVVVGVAILMGAPLSVFALAPLLTVLVSVPFAARLVKYRVVPAWGDFAAAPHIIRKQLPLTLGRLVSVLYTTLVTALVGVLAPTAVALYAASDRILRMGLAVLAGFPARLQSWVGSASPSELAHRRRLVILSNVVLGALAGTVYGVAAPLVADLLFSGEVEVEQRTALIGSIVAVAVCSSRGLGLVLVSCGLQDALAKAAGAAAATGVALMVLVPILGADGALIAVAGAEIAGIVVQGRAIHSRRLAEEGGSSESRV